MNTLARDADRPIREMNHQFHKTRYQKRNHPTIFDDDLRRLQSRLYRDRGEMSSDELKGWCNMLVKEVLRLRSSFRTGTNPRSTPEE